MLRRPTILLACLAASAAHADNKRPPRTYDLIHVSWGISFDEAAQTIAGDVTNTIAPLANGLRVAEFDCVKLSVSKATVEGKPATFHQTADKLDVDLPDNEPKGKQLRVEIVYTGHPQAGVYFVRADRAYPAHTSIVYTQGEMEDTRYWMPTYDYPDDKTTFESFIEVPANYNTLSNGKLVETRNKGDRKIYHWKLDYPESTYLISFVAGPYTESMDHWGSLPVSFFVPTGLEIEGQAAFGGTAKIVEFYSQLTGFKYPYSKFAQSAVADFPFGGMENVTCVTQTINALHEPTDGALTDSSGLVAHELAHQWFGDTITTENWSHTWLNEGFATFLPNFWVRENRGKDAYEIAKYGTFQGGLFGPGKPMVRSDYNDAIEMFDGNAYAGGASRMFMLMHKLGEQNFWRAITDYLNAYKYKNANTDEFFASMSKSTGVDLEAFKKQWFYTVDRPFLTVTRDGTKVTITQPGSMDLDVDLLFVGSKPLLKTVHLNSPTTTVDVPEADGEPFVVDPGCDMMLRITYNTNYSADEWRILYDHTPSAGTKMRILNDVLGAMNLDQKKSLLQSESQLPLRNAILGRGKFDLDTLMSYANGTDVALELTALIDLGQSDKSDVAVARLRTVFDLSPNEVLRSAAMNSLLEQTNDESVAEKGWQTDTFGQSLRNNALNYWQGHYPDKARDLALAQLEHPLNERVRETCIAMLGDLKDKPGETRVYDALVKVLDENDFNPRRAAINALSRYGNPAAIALLQPLTTHSMHYMRNAAKAAIARLQRER